MLKFIVAMKSLRSAGVTRTFACAMGSFVDDTTRPLIVVSRVAESAKADVLRFLARPDRHALALRRARRAWVIRGGEAIDVGAALPGHHHRHLPHDAAHVVLARRQSIQAKRAQIVGRRVANGEEPSRAARELFPQGADLDAGDRIPETEMMYAPAGRSLTSQRPSPSVDVTVLPPPVDELTRTMARRTGLPVSAATTYPRRIAVPFLTSAGNRGSRGGVTGRAGAGAPGTGACVGLVG
jgi:hypothetical protein